MQCALFRKYSRELKFLDHLSQMTSVSIAFMQYASITSTERSFSAYKNLLADNRQSFLFDYIKRALVVQCNSEYE